MIRNVIIALLHVCGIAFAPAPTELPPDVRAALEQNARLIDPISIEFTQILRPLIPAAEIEETFNIDPKSQEAYFARRTTKFSLQGSCEYAFDSHDLPEVTASGTRWANHWESAFDGTWWQHGSPKDRDNTNNRPRPSLNRTHVQHLINSEREGRLALRDYFRAIGLTGPMSWGDRVDKQPLQSTALRMLVGESSLISVLDARIEGQRIVSIEIETRDPNVAHALSYDFDKANERLQWLQSEIERRSDAESLKTEVTRLQRSMATMERLRGRPELRRYVWFLDPSRNFTVVGYEERLPDGTLLLAGANSNFFQPTGRPIWLPRKIVEHRYTDLVYSRVYPKPVLVTEIELKSVDTTPKDPSFFTLAYTTPGSRIRETSADGNESERIIPADDAPPEPPPDATAPTTQSASSARPIMTFAGGACAIVILTACAIAVVRKITARRVA